MILLAIMRCGYKEIVWINTGSALGKRLVRYKTLCCAKSRIKTGKKVLATVGIGAILVPKW